MRCHACGLHESVYDSCDVWLCPMLLLERIRARTVIDENTGCWIFTGAKCASGYGHLGLSRDGVKVDLMPHRIAYEALIGPIPAGMQLDHVREKCSSKACWNPDHLEPVTAQENTRRHFSQQTHCKNGHPLEVLPYLGREGRRGCRVCRSAAAAAATKRRRQRTGGR